MRLLRFLQMHRMAIGVRLTVTRRHPAASRRLYRMSMSMSKVRTAVRFFPEGAGPLWARAVTRGHAPLYEESWTMVYECDLLGGRISVLAPTTRTRP